jgi:hypothetical protein
MGTGGERMVAYSPGSGVAALFGGRCIVGFKAATPLEMVGCGADDNA